MISSLIISALIVVPQVLVVLMAPWAGRSGTKPGPPPASAYRVRRFADQRAVFRFDRRSAASIIVGVQVLDGISATVLGVLTALVTADITAGTGRFKASLEQHPELALQSARRCRVSRPKGLVPARSFLYSRHRFARNNGCFVSDAGDETTDRAVRGAWPGYACKNSANDPIT